MYIMQKFYRYFVCLKTDNVFCRVLRGLSGDRCGQHTTAASGSGQPNDRRTHVPQGEQGRTYLDRSGDDCSRMCVLHRLVVSQLPAGERRQAGIAAKTGRNVPRPGAWREGHHASLTGITGRHRETGKDFCNVSLNIDEFFILFYKL